MSAQDNITFSCEWFMRDWMNKRINETSSTTMQYKNHKCCVYVNDAEYKQEPQTRLYVYFWEWCVQCSAGCVCSTKNHSQRTIYWLDNLVCWCCVFVGAVFFFFSFTRQTHNQIWWKKWKWRRKRFICIFRLHWGFCIVWLPLPMLQHQHFCVSCRQHYVFDVWITMSS